jgi:ribosomal protein L44E
MRASRRYICGRGRETNIILICMALLSTPFLLRAWSCVCGICTAQQTVNINHNAEKSLNFWKRRFGSKPSGMGGIWRSIKLKSNKLHTKLWWRGRTFNLRSGAMYAALQSSKILSTVAWKHAVMKPNHQGTRHDTCISFWAYKQREGHAGIL